MEKSTSKYFRAQGRNYFLGVMQGVCVILAPPMVFMYAYFFIAANWDIWFN